MTKLLVFCFLVACGGEPSEVGTEFGGLRSVRSVAIDPERLVRSEFEVAVRDSSVSSGTVCGARCLRAADVRDIEVIEPSDDNENPPEFLNQWGAAPSSGTLARRYNTTVWTGSEMIIWGGKLDDGSTTNTGARYNPATDTWTATSVAVGMPSDRRAHTAVWTGSEMIVWGGTNDGGVTTNTGARYNPATDMWVATSMNSSVTARSLHTTVWTGSEMIVWGGSGTSGDLGTGARYNPATDAWTLLPTIEAPRARFWHTAVWTGSEMIVWGGNWWDQNGGGGIVLLGTGARYRPVGNTWTSMTSFNGPSARRAHTAVWTDGEMVVWGGLAEGLLNTATGHRYDPVTDTWEAMTNTDSPLARGSHSTVWTGSEMIIWGGSVDGRDGGSGPANTGGRYDPLSDTWVAIPTDDAPWVRYGHGAVWTGSEMIVWGGTATGYSGRNDGGRYSP